MLTFEDFVKDFDDVGDQDGEATELLHGGQRLKDPEAGYLNAKVAPLSVTEFVIGLTMNRVTLLGATLAFNKLASGVFSRKRQRQCD